MRRRPTASSFPGLLISGTNRRLTRSIFSDFFNEKNMKARFLHPMLIGCLTLFGAILLLGTPAEAATVVALGASNTYGKGVARNQAYPAQLEAILRARGSGVHVVNAGINGDTTEGMLRRLDQAVPKGTSAVI
jgi:acyl-CoA thioesterase I